MPYFCALKSLLITRDDTVGLDYLTSLILRNPIMKRTMTRLLCSALMLIAATTASATLNSGYYRIKSNAYDGRYITENQSEQTLSTSGTSTSYAQLWYIDATAGTIRNALSDRYIQASTNWSAQFTTGTTAKAFTITETDGTYTFADGSDYGLHCAASQSYTVVRWFTSDDASVWTIESATYDATEKAAQQAAIAEASASQLTQFFTTAACTALKDTYSSYSDADLRSAMSALPTSVQTLAVKVKNDAWTTYSGWDKTEKTFRIADYKAYADHEKWADALGFQHRMGRLSNPTGIWATSGEVLHVYVGAIPSGQRVKLEVAGYGDSYGATYTLHEGMNSLLMATSGNCFVFYEVDNTTGGKAPFTLMSAYADVTVHIEGGTVQGYLDLTKGDTDSDWEQMKTHTLTDLTNRPSVCLKTDKHVMNLGVARLINALNGSSVTEMLTVWRNLAVWEDELCGRSDAGGGQTTYGQYCNTLYSVTALPGTDGSPHATNFGTYYYEYSDPLIFNAERLLTVADDLWCIAHEKGHNRQTPINMVGNTEMSNNVFSNMAIYNQGRYTSRTASIQVTFDHYLNGISWPDRVRLWCNEKIDAYNQEILHLNWQLYLFFHINGNDPDFFPRLFDALRADPMTSTAGDDKLTPANTDYLKYYVKCCEVSGYDLTEFFAAYGFFMLPPEQTTSLTYNGVTTNRYVNISDYSTYNLYVTQAMIDAAKAEVAAMSGLKACNIIFIEDRVSAPLATYEGHADGELKTLNIDAPVKSFGEVGETGQYTDFGATCSAYTYNVTAKGHVTMSGTGAVGFKLYDASGNLVGFYNTYDFSLPTGTYTSTGLATGYTLKAAGGNGTDAAATRDTNLEVNEDVKDVTLVSETITCGDKVTAESSLVSGKVYLLRNTATGNPWIADAGTYYSVPNGGGTLTAACAYFLIKNSDGTWLVKNYSTGKYWGKPTAASTDNQGGFVPVEESEAGSWTLNFNSNNNIDPKCNGFFINRSSQKLHGWSTSLSSQIYEVPLSTTALEELAGYDIAVSETAASTVETGQWYVMFDRGANHGYLYENSTSHTLYNTSTVPSGTATNNAKYLVRIVGEGGNYYLQTGYGNYFGDFGQSTAVATTALRENLISLKKIAKTDGHYCLTSAAGIVLDANACSSADATVVGYGTSIPTTTGGNNDWAFYPVTLTESWTPTINEVYTLNNTNTSRGALIYNPDASTTYLWSSGKSGTFSATDANSQWVFCPAGESRQYYLYNVGAGKFAVPTKATGGYSGLSWMFSDNAVAMTFVQQSDGTFKLHTANGTAVYLSVSNGQAYPIINYNDAGSQFTVTKVSGDAGTAATAAVGKLIVNRTALTAAPTNAGWYGIRIKTHGTYADRFVCAPEGGITYSGTNYPLSFDASTYLVRPAVTDVTYLTRITKTDGGFNWQLPDGRYFCNSSNKFPVATAEATAINVEYVSGSGFRFSHNSRYAVPYLLSSQYFIGETSTAGNAYYDLYPIDLAEAGLEAWKVVCDNAPGSVVIECTRTDVCGQTTVYKNGYIFLPTGVTPEGSDFVLSGSVRSTVDATAKTVTLDYDPDLSILAESVNVTQGYQTTGRGNENALLLRIDVNPMAAMTAATLTVALKENTKDNISSLYLYEGDALEFIANIPATKLASASDFSTGTATLSIGNVTTDTHHYWLCATVKSDAALGEILDAAVTDISYTSTSDAPKAMTCDLTSVGDPTRQGMKVFAAQTYMTTPTQDGCRYWRIPALIKDRNGDLVAAIDKRYGSNSDLGKHKIDVVSYRSTDGGRTWGSQATVATGDGSSASAYGFGDAALTRAANGDLVCVMAAGNVMWSTNTTDGMMYAGVARSTDNGATWTLVPNIFSTENFYDEVHGTQGSLGFTNHFATSGKGLTTSDGILMYTTNCLESGTKSPALNYILYSVDNGIHWRLSSALAYSGCDESKLEQLSDGTLLLSVRQSGNRGWNKGTYTKNDDGTVTFNWGTQYRTGEITGNACNADIINYGREMNMGTDVLIHSYINSSGRESLQLAMSLDGGDTWEDIYNIQPNGSCYSTMQVLDDGTLAILFEDESYSAGNGFAINYVTITKEQIDAWYEELFEETFNPLVKNSIAGSSTGCDTYGTFSTASSGWYTTWTSKAAAGVAGLTITAPGNDFGYATVYGQRVMALRPSVAGATDQITIAAPEGYYIDSYTITGRNYSSSQAYQLYVDANAKTTTSTGGATFTVNKVNAQSTTFKFYGSSTTNYLCITNFTIKLRSKYPVKLNTVGDASYATLYLPFDVKTDANTKAYVIMETKGSYATLTELPGNEIAANTAVVLVNKTANKATFDVARVLSKLVEENENLLKGTLVDMTLDLSENSRYYSLGRLDGEIGFYKFNNGSTTTITCSANKAYLEVPEAAGIKGFALKFDEEVGILQLENEQGASDKEAKWYDLNGRRLNRVPTTKGIYVVGGKKVVIK